MAADELQHMLMYSSPIIANHAGLAVFDPEIQQLQVTFYVLAPEIAGLIDHVSRASPDLSITMYAIQIHDRFADHRPFVGYHAMRTAVQALHLC